MDETIPNYFKDHNPTEAHYMAVEEESRKRKISCERILKEHQAKELEKRKKLLIPKTKKK